MFNPYSPTEIKTVQDKLTLLHKSKLSSVTHVIVQATDTITERDAEVFQFILGKPAYAYGLFNFCYTNDKGNHVASWNFGNSCD